MASSSDIGANFSTYTGRPELGGYGLGFGRIDTRPIEDLAKYTMLYNRAEYDQRQKDAEAAANQLADLTALDLSTTIPKDAKILQDKFDALTTYVRENPEALNYRNRAQWLEYNKKKADLMNDIKFAKTRSITNVARKNAIAAETNESIKKDMESMLQKNITDTDIRTPLDFEQKYDLEVPEIADNKGLKFDVTKAGANEIGQRTYNFFDMGEGWRNAVNYDLIGKSRLGVGGVTGERRFLKNQENPWVQMKNIFNAAISNPNVPKDANGNIDTEALSGTIPIIKNIEAYNDYVRQTVKDIDGGVYTDKAGRALSFGQGALRRDDYKEINWQDGLDARELGMVAQFSKWAGDQYDTKVIETDNAIQQRGLDLEAARLRENQRQFDLNYGDESVDVRDGAYSILSTIKNAISTGTPRVLTKTETTVTTKDGKEIDKKTLSVPGDKIIEIADANLLNRYRALNKDGTTTITPDAFYYNPDKKSMSIVYYKKDDEGNTLRKNGAPVIADQTPVSFNDWKTNLIGDTYDPKTRGRINNIVSKEIDVYDGDLIKYAENFNRNMAIEEETPGGKKVTKTVTSTSGPSGTTTTVKTISAGDFKKMNITERQNFLNSGGKVQ